MLNTKEISCLLAEIQDMLPDGYSIQFHAEHRLGQTSEHPDVDINFSPQEEYKGEDGENPQLVLQS